jgi:DNA polymerase-3 subunit gamma/tau
MARAVFSPATLVASAAGSVTLGLPNDTHRTKCEQHRSVVEQALSAHSGTDVAVELIVDGGGAGPAGPRGGGAGGGSESMVAPGSTADAVAPTRSPIGDDPAPSMSAGALARDTAPQAATEVIEVTEVAPEVAHLSVVPTPETPPVANGRVIAERARSQGPAPDPDEGLQTLDETLPDDDEVDLDDLVDAPPETVKTPVDRLAEAFPGSELVDDPY